MANMRRFIVRVLLLLQVYGVAMTPSTGSRQDPRMRNFRLAVGTSDCTEIYDCTWGDVKVRARTFRRKYNLRRSENSDDQILRRSEGGQIRKFSLARKLSTRKISSAGSKARCKPTQRRSSRDDGDNRRMSGMRGWSAKSVSDPTAVHRRGSRTASDDSKESKPSLVKRQSSDDGFLS